MVGGNIEAEYPSHCRSFNLKGEDVMKSFARMFGVTIWLCLISLSATHPATAAGAPAPAAPRSLEGIGIDLSDLESLIDHFEKNGETYDEKQRASAYARLLALAEKIGVALHQQRQLLNTAMQSQPGNDPNEGKTKTVTSMQKDRQALLNKLDARLRALRNRIGALDPAKIGASDTVGGAKGTTTTPSGGTRGK
jgi:hypothetical protein